MSELLDRPDDRRHNGGERGTGLPPGPSPARRRFPRLNPFVVAFLVGIATLTALRPLLRHIPEPPPVVGEVPAFALTDQNGRPFEKRDLLGRVTIANVFCTRCEGANKDVMKGMLRIANAYADRGIDRIGFVSITSDPTDDTPERLREYARALGAQEGRWTFLTGDAAAAHDLAVGLFKDADRADRETDARGASTGRADTRPKPLVLIDQRARIRGWYAADEMGLDEVYNRAQHVLAEPPRQR